jgi:hypothetical protein
MDRPASIPAFHLLAFFPPQDVTELPGKSSCLNRIFKIHLQIAEGFKDCSPTGAFLLGPCTASALQKFDHMEAFLDRSGCE